MILIHCDPLRGIGLSSFSPARHSPFLLPLLPHACRLAYAPVVGLVRTRRAEDAPYRHFPSPFTDWHDCLPVADDFNKTMAGRTFVPPSHSTTILSLPARYNLTHTGRIQGLFPRLPTPTILAFIPPVDR